MARVTGFQPAQSGQEPQDSNGNPVPAGVWGDSTTGVGVFGTNGTLAPGDVNIPANVAGVEGHSTDKFGVAGQSTYRSRGGGRQSHLSRGVGLQ